MKNLFLVTAVSIATLTTVPSVALAQQKSLYVAGYGGSFEKTIRDEVIPAFEKANGVKVEYVAGNSTDTLAKLQAQKGNQQIDVAIVDDGPAYQAVALGFCGALRPPPHKKLANSNLDEKDRSYLFRRPINNDTICMPKCYGTKRRWRGSIRGRLKPSAR